MKNQELAGKLAFYENSHSPSFANNIPTRQKKVDRAKKNSPPKKAGAKIGRVDKSHKRKPARKEIHTPKKCTKCGNKNITVTKTTTKMMIDIPYIPEIEATNNIIHHQLTQMCSHLQ